MDQDVYKAIRRIQIYTTKAVNDLLAGAYHSAFKGQGIEFEEVRDYQPGDDIRSIDWNVTARMQHPYIKSFREERELTVFLLVDVSGSSRFGSEEKSKAEVIAELGATIAFSAIANKDKIGLILFSDQIEQYLPPQKGTRHVLRVIRELLIHENQHRKTNIQNALSFLQKVRKREAVCFLISDFIDTGYEQELNLASKHYDLIPVRLTDPREQELPDSGWLTIQDLESGETRVVNTKNPQVKEQLKRRAAERTESYKRITQRAGCDPITIQTNQSPIDALARYFTLRRRKR